jgi:hypothetical protein
MAYDELSTYWWPSAVYADQAMTDTTSDMRPDGRVYPPQSVVDDDAQYDACDARMSHVAPVHAGRDTH